MSLTTGRILQRLRRKYKGWIRLSRKMHPAAWPLHICWWLLCAIIYSFYFDLPKIVAPTLGEKLYLFILQVLYFYIAVFLLLPPIFRKGLSGGKKKFLFLARPLLRMLVKARYLTWVEVILSFALKIVFVLALETVAFMLLIVGVSIIRGRAQLDLRFYTLFDNDIVNLGEVLFPYIALAPIISLLFFFLECLSLENRIRKRNDEIIGRKEEMIRLLDAEWVKWQVDPHLMSNVFTGLRDEMRSADQKQRIRATNYVISLMDFYLIKAGPADTVPLKDDAAQVRSLLAMWRLAGGTRKQRADYVKLEISSDTYTIHIHKTLLLILAQNMLVHATHLDRKNPAFLRAWVADGNLMISATNHFDPSVSRPIVDKNRSHGVALHVLKKRLPIVHPGSQLIYRQEDGQFMMEISIPVPDKKQRIKVD